MPLRTHAIRFGLPAALICAAAGVPAFSAEPADPLVQLTARAGGPQAVPHWSRNEPLKLRYFSSLIMTGQLDLLETEMARYPLRGRFAEQRTRFFRGAILRRRGKKAEAVKIFRAILAQNPELGKVRAELAATLYEMEDDDAAKHHLNRLLSANANDASHKVFKNLLDHIDQRRPWQFGGYATLAPSTNFKKGSRHRTVNLGPLSLNINNREESGIGIQGGAYGSYTHRLKNNISLITAGSVGVTSAL